MSADLRQLYESRPYPPMSHPLSDPAVSTVAAWIGGLDAVHPARARVLEIGCASGLNLLPLAMRWPEARFTGIDLAESAINTARDLAREAGVRNTEFQACDFREFHAPPRSFDIIIAHGVFSWVADEVKTALLAFCRDHLAATGFATLSFNLSCGWRGRLPVIGKTRAIQQAGNVGVMEALRVLREVSAGQPEDLAVIDDMLAKGPDVLPFDDFAPVNDPWPLERFVAAAESAGLSWVGESDPAGNFPPDLPPELAAELRSRFTDPLTLQCAADEAVKRTFRSGLLCLAEAERAPGIHPKHLLELPVRIVKPAAPPVIREAFERADAQRLSCLPQSELRIFSQNCGDRDWLADLWRGMLDGSLQVRTDQRRLSPEAPEFPRLDPLRLACARRGMPVVDVWHTPCTFPIRHQPVVAAMDGTRSRDSLRRMARERCPDLAFDPWLRHLAGRGMFC